ncbi:hypothetical protein PsorP6_017360 [Peronosclerospora sorghi]|uniref:Uncharacterized protein n=1 Tax=Peronosclerospora sorghi TaxID=230839 RepID=A0ACC0WMT6_9STRA|nr:hypothetical protein PsorP6_017360 [Peronosclerospora sorghi]
MRDATREATSSRGIGALHQENVDITSIGSATVALEQTASAVGLRSPAAGAAAVKVSVGRPHESACLAASSLDTNGMPRAQPSENR